MKTKHTQEGTCSFQWKFPPNSPLFYQYVPLSLSELTRAGHITILVPLTSIHTNVNAGDRRNPKLMEISLGARLHICTFPLYYMLNYKKDVTECDIVL